MVPFGPDACMKSIWFAHKSTPHMSISGVTFFDFENRAKIGYFRAKTIWAIFRLSTHNRYTGSLISDWFFLDTYKWGKNNPFKWCHGFFWTLRHVSLMQSFWFYEIRPLNTRPVWSAVWIWYISRALDFAVVAKNSLKSMLNLNWT